VQLAVERRLNAERVLAVQFVGDARERAFRSAVCFNSK
jgi:hypothetical protein